MKRHHTPLALTCSALVAGLVIVGLSFTGQLGSWIAVAALVAGTAWVALAPAPVPVRVPRDR